MENIVNKNTTKEEFDLLLKKLNQKKKQKDISKFLGILNKDVDGLEFQKKIRNEWE